MLLTVQVYSGSLPGRALTEAYVSFDANDLYCVERDVAHKRICRKVIQMH